MIDLLARSSSAAADQPASLNSVLLLEDHEVVLVSPEAGGDSPQSVAKTSKSGWLRYSMRPDSAPLSAGVSTEGLMVAQ